MLARKALTPSSSLLLEAETSQAAPNDQALMGEAAQKNQNIIKLPDDIKLPEPFDLVYAIARPLRLEDITSLKPHFNDYEVVRNFSKGAVPWPLPEGWFEEYIQTKLESMAQGKSIVYVILPKAGPKANKAVGLYDFHFEKVNKVSNRGYWLGQKYWGQGWMGKMVAAMDDFLFGVLNIEEYSVSNVIGNEASHKIKLTEGAILTTDPELLAIAKSIEYHDLDETADLKGSGRMGAEVWDVTRNAWLECKLGKKFEAHAPMRRNFGAGTILPPINHVAANTNTPAAGAIPLHVPSKFDA